MNTKVLEKAVEIVTDRVEVCEVKVAAALADDIVNRDTFDTECADDILAGVSAAIEEIDDATFDAAFDLVQSRVAVEIEGQAKRIALRLLRELAAQAKAATAAAC
jgi:predicted N-acetyltransferase YhbS